MGVHVPLLIKAHHGHAAVHGSGRIGKFNAWLAVRITRSVGTMWMAYLFAMIGIGSLVGLITNNVFLALVCGALSSYFLQLVLLPIIIVGQNVQQAANDLKSEADHATLIAIHNLEQETFALQAIQIEILKALKERK